MSDFRSPASITTADGTTADVQDASGESVGPRAGTLSRARLCVTAVERLVELETTRRAVRAEDCAVLAQWCGWGPLAAAFDRRADANWRAVGAALRELLDDDAWAAGEQATPTSYYTPRWLATAMWEALAALGFAGGRTLEPGCGHGLLLDTAPVGADIAWTAIERDPVSARIARILHPNVDIITAALETTALRDGEHEAVVGNVPFAEYSVYDPLSPRRYSLHNYFLARAVRALRPGGIALLLTSHFTLDTESALARNDLAELAQLLGAVRLPTGAFTESGTQVIADIVVLRRRRDGDLHDAPWLRSSLHGNGLTYNDYFDTHPEHIIGVLERGSGTYRTDPMRVRFDAGTMALQTAVRGALLGIARGAVVGGWSLPTPLVGVRPLALGDSDGECEGRKQGSFHTIGGEVRQVVGRTLQSARDNPELRTLIQLRDAALALLAAEAQVDATDAELEPLRAHLNLLYDTYVAHYGAVNRCSIVEGPEDPETGLPLLQRRRPPMGGFRQDPDYVTVLALESYDDDTGESTKAPLLRHRVNRPAKRATRAETPADAVALTLDACGSFDLRYAARLLRLDEATAVDALGDLIFRNPATQQQEIAAEYLSGNVRRKLAEARDAAERDPERYARNLAALQAVHPQDLTPTEISVRLGAPWVDVDDVTAFITETIGDVEHGVHRVPAAALWEVSASTWQRSRPAATTEWGTGCIDAYKLVEMALNGRAPVVYDEIERDGAKVRVRNVQESMLAAEKLQALNQRFSEWIWETPERADRLAERYNRLFNSTVVRTYDGSHLTFPGIAPDFVPYQSQKDIAYRIAASPAALCGFAVGAGKTAAMFMAAMTLRRLGLAAKPMIVVPNHLLEQVARDGKSLYPLANVLMASTEDVSAERRRLFAARCAMGDWDAVVITHSAFTSLSVDPTTEAEYLGDVLARYRSSLYAEHSAPQSRSVKRVAKMVESMEQRQRALLDHRTDTGVTFEQLGVDFLLVDESHYFKRLSTPCMTDGFNLEGSKCATDLAMKFRWLRGRTNGARSGALFTGTPISNSLAELFVIQTYLQPVRLAELDLDAFDAWARNFVEFETRVEVAPDGGSFRLHSRPSRFHNLPDLRRLLAEVADIRTADILNLPRPEAVYETVVVPPSPELEAYVATLVRRAEALRSGQRGGRDNMLVICSDGRKAALDLELVGMRTEHPGKVEYVVERVLHMWRTVKAPPVPTSSSTSSGQVTGRRLGQTSLFARPRDAGGLGRAVQRTPQPEALQIVFCDQGTPREGSAQVYGKIRAGLVAGGMPARLIRFVHDAKTDSAKALLFADCRAGKVAVLLGSTDKLGVGTNIQRFCTALHHVDAPWRPADIEQREGRPLRPGNLNAVVRIFRYVTERSFDSYMWQALERKARFIAQILTGRLTARVIEDIGDVALTYAEVKALATGNPLLLEQAEAQAQVACLRQLAIAHERGRLRARSQIERFHGEAALHDAHAALWRTVADAAGPMQPMLEIDGTPVDVTAEPTVLAAALRDALAGAARGFRLQHVGRWCGLDLRIEIEQLWPAQKGWFLIADTESTGSERVEIRTAWAEPDRARHLSRVLREAAAAAAERASQEEGRRRACLAEVDAAAALLDAPFPGALDLRRAESRLATISKAIEASVEGAIAA